MKATVTIAKKSDDSFIDMLSVRWADGWEMRCAGLQVESREPCEFETEFIRAEMHGGRSRFSFIAKGGGEVTFLAIDAPVFAPAEDVKATVWNGEETPTCS